MIETVNLFQTLRLYPKLYHINRASVLKHITLASQNCINNICFFAWKIYHINRTITVIRLSGLLCIYAFSFYDYISLGLTREIKFLTEHLGRQWKDLARSLGLTENDLECIADENPTNLREKIRQSLLLWQKRYQEKATKTALVCALYDSNLVELSEMIQEDA